MQGVRTSRERPIVAMYIGPLGYGLSGAATTVGGGPESANVRSKLPLTSHVVLHRDRDPADGGRVGDPVPTGRRQRAREERRQAQPGANRRIRVVCGGGGAGGPRGTRGGRLAAAGGGHRGQG